MNRLLYFLLPNPINFWTCGSTRPWVLKPREEGPDQGLTNYDPWIKYGPPSVFVIKVLLNHNHPICLQMVYGYFQAIMGELGICHRDSTAHKCLKYYYLALYRKKYADQCPT